MANVNGRPITAKQRAAFLQFFSETGNVSQAAEAAGFNRVSAYRLRHNDPDFAKAWKEAEERAADMLEAEARRRAVEGTERYVIAQGKLVNGPDGKPLIERAYSDRLLEILLRAHRPDKFADRKQITGRDGGPVKVVTLREMTEEELMALAAAEGEGDDSHLSSPGSPNAGTAANPGGGSES